MKTKKKTYVLLVLVVAVWGTIGYKIVSALNPEIPEVQPQSFAENTNFRIDTKMDTFSVNIVNRDPFLGTLLIKETKSPIRKKRKPIDWKPVTYQGIIKQDKEQIFIVSISGNQYLLKKGQTKDSITLAYGSDKSVTMRYKKQLKSFSLKQ